MKNNKIIFTNFSDNALENPKPASKFLPDWYKNHASYLVDNKKVPMIGERTSGTIKKCMPVLDVMSSGYIITTAVDIYVKQENNNGKKLQVFLYSDLDYISTHNIDQVDTKRKNMPEEYVPKIANVWGIKTPKGYSCLFIPPVHRDNLVEILPGVVDTDKYYNPVQFPFLLSDKTFEGLIPAGTPVAQIIPFKRESWKLDIGFDKKEGESQSIQLSRVFFDAYKKLFWTKKEYR